MARDDEDFLAYLRGRGQGMNPYGAGNKQYGLRGAPNIGPVDKMGYRERDARANPRRNALLRRLQAMRKRKFMDPDVLRGM